MEADSLRLGDPEGLALGDREGLRLGDRLSLELPRSARGVWISNQVTSAWLPSATNRAWRVAQSETRARWAGVKA